MAVGFASGALITAILIYCLMQTPVTANFPSRQNFRSAAGKTLLSVVRVLNVFSFQGLTPAGEDDLRNLGILPKKKKKTDSGIVPKSSPASESADHDNAKKDSIQNDSGSSRNVPSGLKPHNQ